MATPVLPRSQGRKLLLSCVDAATLIASVAQADRRIEAVKPLDAGYAVRDGRGLDAGAP